MIPTINVILALLFAVLALFLGLVKKFKPGSRIHRYGGRFAAILGLVLLGSMGMRFLIYQVPLSSKAMGHSALGVVVFLLLAGKLLAARKWLLPGRFLYPMGYALLTFTLLAASAMSVPFLLKAKSWKSLSQDEIKQDPRQEDFNGGCITCHHQETALEGQGQRAPADWIWLAEQMAWAGSMEHDNTRGALAFILADHKPVETASGSPSLTPNR